MVYRFLRSQSLAVGLLLALAVLAAAGTYFAPASPDPSVPAREAPLLVRALGLQQVFGSPLFLSLVFAAAVNVTACTWHRLSRRLRDGGWRAWTDLALHASLLLVLAGGLLKGWLGFVGTQHVAVGQGTGTLYDWRSLRDEPLGFEVRVEEFRESYYPVKARVGIRRAGTSERLGVLEVVQGAESVGPGGDPRIRLDEYDSAAGAIAFSVAAGGERRSIALRTQAKDAVPVRVGAYDLVLVAYRADLRDARARVAVVESGSVAASGWLSPNTGLSHRGLTLFLTAWGADAQGNRFCGIQGARDPGAPLFWAGCVLLSLAVPAHFLAKGRKTG